MQLKEGTDYTLTYSNNTEIGKADVIITGKGEYSGKKKVSFNITGGSVAKAKVTGLVKTAVYTGSAITQNCKLTVALNGSTKILREGTDYTVEYANNVHAGKATITFKGINGFNGVLKKSFTITAFDIGSKSGSKFKITMPETVPYTKGGSTPKPEITFNGAALCEGVDYTLSYKNNKAVTANGETTKIPELTVKGKGDFKGVQKLDFHISTQDISKLTLSAADKIYQNKSNRYETTVRVVDFNGKKLSLGKDYDKNIVYTYAERTKLADGTIRKAGEEIGSGDIVPALTQIQVTVNAAENSGYTGSVSGTYRIVKSDIAKVKVTVETQEYTGEEVKPNKEAITVKIGKEVLEPSMYEIVSYGDNCVNKGKNTITIKGVGNYGGTKTVSYKIRAKSFWWWWRK